MSKPITDQLDVLRDGVRELRDKEREIADLEERLKQLRTECSEIRHRTLPELFRQAQVDKIGLPAEGNRPAVDAKLRNEYKAAVPASWPTEKRLDAFKVLDELNLGNIVKITYTIVFEAGQRSQADEFGTLLTMRNYAFNAARAVHHATLSAALKEICEAGEVPSLPQLEAIGGFIGTSVDLKTRRQ
jgi:hypothetical protein